jgi:FtsP/CotA-like multicopper oxidase with cupredoxin domain
MFFNVFGERVSRARYKEMLNAAKNRRELIAAQYDRRELIKMGLVTAAGLLAPIKGLSARALPQQGIPNLCASGLPGDPGNQPASPPTTPFTEPLPILPIAEAVPVASLGPAPTINPNTAAGEGRTRPHQAFTLFPPAKFFNVTQKEILHSFSKDLPRQPIWGFDDSKGHVSSPAPTYVFRYGVPVLVRNHNALPPEGQNRGFGKPSVSTHLHNHHTPSESDGFPGDFFERNQFYDQHYPNQLAGVLSTHRAQGGDINEALSSLWFHDHRLNFTSQNTYKGLLGLCCIFNEFDTGDEHTGFHLPSFPEFDIPMAFQDKVFDSQTGLLAFDLFNLDGILGDKFLINGQIQPFFKVKPRRYRFRMVDTGPSRFYEFFLTDPKNLDAVNPYWLIANDGNLLPRPVKVTSARIGVAERVDVIVDFRPFAGKSIFLENRLSQVNGQGPVIGQECGIPEVMPAGKGSLLMRFDVDSAPVRDDSEEPEEMTFYSLPEIVEPRITRTFKFDRLNGQWSVNGQFVGDVKTPRLRVGMNTAENWVLSNITGNWTHPVHIHFEEHQILSRNRVPPSLAIERSRKDVTQLKPNSRAQLFFRFRDFHGRYPLHCHNLIHEDHAMMLRWDIDPDGGDEVLVP